MYRMAQCSRRSLRPLISYNRPCSPTQRTIRIKTPTPLTSILSIRSLSRHSATPFVSSAQHYKSPPSRSTISRDRTLSSMLTHSAQPPLSPFPTGRTASSRSPSINPSSRLPPMLSFRHLFPTEVPLLLQRVHLHLLPTTSKSMLMINLLASSLTQASLTAIAQCRSSLKPCPPPLLRRLTNASSMTQVIASTNRMVVDLSRQLESHRMATMLFPAVADT